ncbi:MAG: hypothetical protein LUC43_07170, partial [Burkholderiales bacterium]|nr:hypothetical protein [Burkholderiales bacterium]
KKSNLLIQVDESTNHHFGIFSMKWKSSLSINSKATGLWKLEKVNISKQSHYGKERCGLDIHLDLKS